MCRYLVEVLYPKYPRLPGFDSNLSRALRLSCHNPSVLLAPLSYSGVWFACSWLGGAKVLTRRRTASEAGGDAEWDSDMSELSDSGSDSSGRMEVDSTDDSEGEPTLDHTGALLCSQLLRPFYQ